jgi:hypothetical protein
LASKAGKKYEAAPKKLTNANQSIQGKENKQCSPEETSRTAADYENVEELCHPS